MNLGDDADTTAAVYGQIAGAVYGELAIPAHWRRKLAHAALISRLTDQLWDAGQAAATMPDHRVAPAAAPEAPLPETFWIAPGQLLAGNYPAAPTRPKRRPSSTRCSAQGSARSST